MEIGRLPFKTTETGLPYLTASQVSEDPELVFLIRFSSSAKHFTYDEINHVYWYSNPNKDPQHANR